MPETPTPADNPARRYMTEPGAYPVARLEELAPIVASLSALVLVTNALAHAAGMDPAAVDWNKVVATTNYLRDMGE